MIVARPISCMASDVGIPARLLSSCSSLEKARHSGPISSILSVTTNPQLPQNISPLELSVTIGPFPQRGQRSLNTDISFTKFLHHKISDDKKGRFRHLIFILFSVIYGLPSSSRNGSLDSEIFS